MATGPQSVTSVQGLIQPTTRPPESRHLAGLPALYSWSVLQFEVHPLNVHEVDHGTESDYAKKPMKNYFSAAACSPIASVGSLISR